MSDSLSSPVILPPRPPGAWTPAKVRIFREQFYEFLNYVKVNSKENGPMILGDHLYGAQKRFLDGTFSALENDIHTIKVLKGRQQGISTIARALSLYWLGMHDGLKGYCVLDTDQHKEEARIELVGMADGLPGAMKFPAFVNKNRYMLTLGNGSMTNFASAGIKSSKSSGTLGRSSGINFAHLSEVCSFADEEGMISLENAFAEHFPNRLYVYESTARGHNLWFDIWQKGRADPNHTQCIFIGWYFKETQRIDESDPDYARYALIPPNAKERAVMAEVEKLYGYKISMPQLAWYRRKMDPTAIPDGSAEADWSGSALQIQEQPNTEAEAFQQTGSKFFDGERIANIRKEIHREKYDTWRFETGIEFTDCRIVRASTSKQVELRVWEEPVAGACYVVSADPAYGTDAKNDRAAMQVLRCYADGVEQVAEYAWPTIQSKQFGWVILAIASWYAAVASDVYLIVELQGGGQGTWDEIQEVKRLVSQGYLAGPAADRGLTSMFSNIRTFINTKADSLNAQKTLQWKTTPGNKVRLMDRFRDFHNNGMLKIHSSFLLDEMVKIVREGQTIGAAGSGKDDRVMAMAFAIHAWEHRARKLLLRQNRTKSAEAAQRKHSIADQVFLFHKYQVESIFSQKRTARIRQERQSRFGRWRSGGDM